MQNSRHSINLYPLLCLMRGSWGDDDQIPSMNLVGISIATGAVTSSVLACKHFPDCPWNIQYLNQ